MKRKKNKTLIILLITLIIILAIGSTVAFFGWIAEEEATVNVTIASGTGECSLISDNNIFIEPSSTKNEGRIISLKSKQEMGGKTKIVWNMIINRIDGLQDRTFKYEMINKTTGASYGSGTFENVTNNSTIALSSETEVLDFGVEYEFTLYLWIDGTIGNNPIRMADQVFNFDINCNITSVE